MLRTKGRVAYSCIFSSTLRIATFMLCLVVNTYFLPHFLFGKNSFHTVSHFITHPSSPQGRLIPHAAVLALTASSNIFLFSSTLHLSVPGVFSKDHPSRRSRRIVVQRHHPLPASQSRTPSVGVNHPHPLPCCGESSAILIFLFSHLGHL